MPVPTVEKHPYEQFNFLFDFSEDMGASDTISSLVSVKSFNHMSGIETTAQMIGNTAIVSAGKKVSVELKDGAESERHRVEVRVITSATEKLQGDGFVNIIPWVT